RTAADLARGRLKLFFQQREQPPANARAQTRLVEIRRILAPLLPPRSEERTKLRAAHSEQRPDYSPGNGMNAPKPRHSCSAKNMRQDGLRLIIGRVRDGAAIDSAIPHQPLEKLVPQPPSRFFNVRARLLCFHGDVRAVHVEHEPPF